MRFGIGELITDEIEVNEARSWFLVEIERVAAGVIQDLFESVFLVDPRGDSLQWWANRHNLNADWVLDQAHQTLSFWASLDVPRKYEAKWGIIAVGDCGAFLGSASVFEVSWNPASETRGAAKARITAEIDTWMTSASSALKTRGWRRPTEKRDRGRGGGPMAHFTWAALWTTGCSFHDIAEELDADLPIDSSGGIDLTTIEKGVRKALDFIGLQPSKRPK